MQRIIIVGGGITGLAAAYRLSQRLPGAGITILEAEDRLGGKIVTEHVEGFTIEGGPDSFLAAKPRGVGLATEVGLGSDLIAITPRRRRAFVLLGNTLHELPEGLSGLVPTRLGPLARSGLLSPTGKARAALDYVLPPRRGDDDESLGGFIRRRLGAETWERLVEPLMAGIYAADGDQLSLAATFPQLRELELAHGSLIRGTLANRRAATGQPAKPAFLTPYGGLGDLVTSLEARLIASGGVIRTRAGVDALSTAPGGYIVRLQGGESLPADAVVLATPAFATADLMATLHSGLAGELRDIPHSSTAIVTLAFRRDQIAHPLDAHGYVVPRVAGGSILACTWSSQKWTNRAPDGWELFRVFIGRAGQHDALVEDDGRLARLARDELAIRIGVTAAPALTRVQRWPRGMPQYLLGHPERIGRIEGALAALPGIFLAGNAYRGVGIPDCIGSGERAADAADAFLSRAAVGVARATALHHRLGNVHLASGRLDRDDSTVTNVTNAT